MNYAALGPEIPADHLDTVPMSIETWRVVMLPERPLDAIGIFWGRCRCCGEHMRLTVIVDRRDHCVTRFTRMDDDGIVTKLTPEYAPGMIIDLIRTRIAGR